jgi:hypothetical protein
MIGPRRQIDKRFVFLQLNKVRDPRFQDLPRRVGIN